MVTTEGADFYPTPTWAVRALLSQEKFIGSITEPCCGNGQISEFLIKQGYAVNSSDLHEYNYGTSGVDAREITEAENIISNPPYNLAEEIIQHCLNITKHKTAMLLRLAFVESVKRYSFFIKHPPARLYVFPERLSLSPKDTVVTGGGTVAYAWFIWDKEYSGETLLRWLPVGFKNRYEDLTPTTKTAQELGL